MLAKPLGRAELIAGKWIGAWSVTVVATVIFYLCVALVAVLRGGRIQPVAMLQGCLLHSVALALVCGMALLCSTRMHQDAAKTMAWV